MGRIQLPRKSTKENFEKVTASEVINRELAEAERKELQLLERQKEYTETHLSEFFKPLPYQQKILDFIHSGKRTIGFVAANQTGKTTLGANIVAMFALGFQPWDKKPSPFGDRKIAMRLICSDWEKHSQNVIVPELRKWLPVDSYEQPRKNNIGIEAYWTFKRTGSTLELITNKQDTRDHEGWKGHVIWCDESLDRDKYTANQRGLVANQGIFIITMTDVKQSWIVDDLLLKADPSIGVITDVTMRDNPYLKEEAIRQFERDCTAEEREARVYGRLVRLVGRICKEFSPDIHIIEPFELMHDWPVIVMIDTHPAKEQAMGFYAVDPRDIHYVVDEIWEHLSPEEIVDRIIKKKDKHQWRLEEAFIDPLAKGDDHYMRNRANVQDSYTIIERGLAPAGIRLQVASKDKNSGIKNIRNGLLGPNKMPSLFFFKTCERHLWEIQRWKWDDDGRATKENDDFMENLYRYTLTGNKYYPLIRQTRQYAGAPIP